MDARDLSFRAKRIDGEGWAYGDVCNGEYGKIFILYDNDAVITCKKKELTSWGFIEVDPKTVGMYTGFQDSKGFRIYDGDILKLKGSYEEIHEIVWLNGCFHVHNKKGYPYWPLLFEVIDGMHEGETYEIIGNIHDREEENAD